MTPRQQDGRPGQDAIAQVEALYRDHGPRVLAYLARRVRPAEDAADLLSEVMMISWRRCEDLPPAPEDVPWLFGVARNVLANHRRAEGRRDVTVVHLAQLLRRQLTQPGDRPTEQVDASLDLGRALADLSDVDREIVTLSAWEELTSTEIGIVLGLRAVTVRSRLRRARVKLRARLDPTEDDALFVSTVDGGSPGARTRSAASGGASAERR